MALSRTWYSDGNFAASATNDIGRCAIWSLKCFMKKTLGTVDARGGWTVEGSSNGTTAGMDAVDRWTDVFVPANLVWAAIGTARSWIVMKSPAAMGPYYLLIDCTANTDGSTAWIMMWASKVAFTGGTTTARPTSTKEWPVHQSASVSPLRTQIWEGTVAAHNFHYTADASGNFWFHSSKTGSQIFHWSFGFQKLTENRTADLQATVTIVSFQSSARGSFDGSAANGAFGSANIAQGTVGGRNGADAVSHGPNEIVVMMPFINASSWAAQIGPNATDGTFDVFPSYVGSVLASSRGVRGRLPDVSFIGGQSTPGSGATVGSSQPSSGSQEQMVVGNLLMPSSVAPNL